MVDNKQCSKILMKVQPASEIPNPPEVNYRSMTSTEPIEAAYKERCVGWLLPRKAIALQGSSSIKT